MSCMWNLPRYLGLPIPLMKSYSRQNICLRSRGLFSFVLRDKLFIKHHVYTVDSIHNCIYGQIKSKILVLHVIIFFAFMKFCHSQDTSSEAIRVACSVTLRVRNFLAEPPSSMFTERFFAVIDVWDHYVVVTLSYKLISFLHLHFLAHDSIYAIARSLPSPVRLSVCLSVWPSVCPSHGWISQRRFKLG